MKRTLLRMASVGTALCLSAGVGVVLSGTAQATNTPTWEDGSDTNENGTITLYDSSGAVVTSGNVSDKPIAAYAVASTTLRAGDTLAVLEAAQPNPSANVGNWNLDYLNSSSTFPVTSGPSNIQTLSQTQPVVTGTSGDLSLKQFENEFSNSDPSGNGCAYSPGAVSGCTNTDYENYYQLRIQTSDGSALTTSYATMVVQISNATYDPSTGALTGGTWTQVYPAPVVQTSQTTTALTGSPATAADQGAQVTLTATVTAADSSAPAGTVQFMDGSTAIGSPVAVVPGSGQSTASTTWSSTTTGAHALTADFTPTSSTAYTTSTGSLSYTINAVAPQWKPTLYGTVRVGSTVACVASFDNATTTSYSWFDNGVAISGATASTYKIADALYGHYLSCSVVATNGSGGPTTSGTSSQVKVAIGPALVAARKPFLYNKNYGHVTTHGTYEYVTPGAWSPAATSYTYQWYVGSTAIAHATSYRFAIPRSYVGKYLRCVVTAHRADWTNGAYRTAFVKVAK